LIVENSPQQLWKAPVSTAHNGIGNAHAGCGLKVDISRSNSGPKRKRPGAWRARSRNAPEMGGYFSELLMVLKFVDSWVPRPFTAVMIAIAIPAAIRPYSMAVAPDSSLKNDLMIDFIAGSDLG
jgi:hypothetical protein